MDELMKQNGQNGMPAWVIRMREAAQKCIKETDIQEMVQAQVVLAKKGNPAALRFVFEQVLGGGSLKGMTLVQENHYAADSPAFRQVTDAPALSDETNKPVIRDLAKARANAVRSTR